MDYPRATNISRGEKVPLANTSNKTYRAELMFYSLEKRLANRHSRGMVTHTRSTEHVTKNNTSFEIEG